MDVNELLCFAGGLFVGVLIGMLILSCCVLSKRGDDECDGKEVKEIKYG